MRLALDYESRIPLRAAVAVALALALGELSDPDPLLRWYWAVLVAAVLVNGTWGDSTKRGLARFAMTVVGAAAGWDLHVLFGQSHAARIAILLAAIGLAVYFRGRNYGWFTFFITIYVVSLFEVLQAPTALITLLRIYQTFVGCGIAMAAALFVPMPRASDQWERDADEFLKICRAAAERSFERLLGSSQAGAATGANAETGIVPQLGKLRNDCKSASYETVFDRATHRTRNIFMDRAWQLAQAVLSLDSVSRIEAAASALSGFRNDLASLRAATLGGSQPSALLDNATFESFRAKLAEGRGNGLSTEYYLVLDAVAQFSADIAAMTREAERQIKRD